MLYRRSCLVTLMCSSFFVWAAAQSAFAQDQSQQNDQQSQKEQSESQESSQHQQSQDKNSQAQRDRNALSGTIQSYREVAVNGTQHFRIRLQTQNGNTQSVDLGPLSQNQRLVDSLEQGDHISVQGRTESLNGKNVFCAQRVKLNGETYLIAQSKRAHSSDDSESASAGEQGQQSGQSQQNAQGQQRPMVYYDQQMIFVTPSDLSRHLIVATEELQMGQNKEAAAELRVAADRIGVYAAAEKMQKNVTQDLARSHKELLSLADKISRGGDQQQEQQEQQEQSQLQQLDQAAIHAQLAMAKYFDNQFRADKGNSHWIEAGYDLQAAATHARQALMWTNENSSTSMVRSIRQALRTADQMISGNGQQESQNASQIAQNLSRQIDQIGQQADEGSAQPASARQHGEKSTQQQRDEGQQNQADHQSQNKKHNESDESDSSSSGQ